MNTLDLIKDNRDEIYSVAFKYGVNKIRLFGSAARKEDNSGSDIDFLVDFDSDRSLFDLIGFKHSLEEIFNRKVDVITFDSLHQDIKEKVLNDMIEI